MSELLAKFRMYPTWNLYLSPDFYKFQCCTRVSDDSAAHACRPKHFSALLSKVQENTSNIINADDEELKSVIGCSTLVLRGQPIYSQLVRSSQTDFLYIKTMWSLNMLRNDFPTTGRHNIPISTKPFIQTSFHCQRDFRKLQWVFNPYDANIVDSSVTRSFISSRIWFKL